MILRINGLTIDDGAARAGPNNGKKQDVDPPPIQQVPRPRDSFPRFLVPNTTGLGKSRSAVAFSRG
jgi:hypothetical protein